MTVRPSSSGQDDALSRRKQGFDSPWAYHFLLLRCSMFQFGLLRAGHDFVPPGPFGVAVVKTERNPETIAVPEIKKLRR